MATAMAATGLVSGGHARLVADLRIVNWFDDPRRRLDVREHGGDGCPRITKWVRSIGLHTTMGLPATAADPPQRVLPGIGPAADFDARVERFWRESSGHAGAHLLVDHDGTIYQGADVLSEVAYHAGPANEPSIGIELKQRADGALFAGQILACCRLVEHLEELFGIQRQFHAPYRGPIDRLAIGCGENYVGVFGHRDVTSMRGLGDPGTAVFDALAARGHEASDFAAEQDRVVWASRQVALNQTVAPNSRLIADGIPGPKTRAALQRAGYQHGLWAKVIA
jgi:hypothetical protein